MAYRGFPPGAKGPPSKPTGRTTVRGDLPVPLEEPPRPPSKPPPKRPLQSRTVPPESGGKTPPLARSLTKAQTLPPNNPTAKRAQVQEAVPSIIVFSTDPDDELGIQTLICGEYSAEGVNHGRTYFKKICKHPSDEEVRLYYWDERDGEDFSGWWIGDQVGGVQVWLHNHDRSTMPPRSGWTWREREVRDELLVMSPEEKIQFDLQNGGTHVQQEGNEAEEEGQAEEEREMDVEEHWQEEQDDGQETLQENERQQQADPIAAEWEECVQRATDHVAAVESDAVQALEMAQLAMDSDLGLKDDSILRAQELLEAQAQPLMEAQRIAAREGLTKADAPPAVRTAAVELTQRVRTLHANVKAAEKRLANARSERAQKEQEDQQRAKEEARVRELEVQHSAQLEEMLRMAMEKVNSVEDEVEKVEIAATPLEVDSGDGLQSVMLQAVKETEQHVRSASTALAEGRRFVTAKIAQAKRLLQGMKSSVLDELIALQDKLNDAQTKLATYGSIRQTYEQKVQAKKVLDELVDKLATAEMQVERAVLACAPLGGESVEATKEAETILGKAGVAVSQASRLVEAKIKVAAKVKGPLMEGLEEMQSRTKQMEDRIQESQQALKDMKDRAIADAWMRDISEKSESVEIELQRMREADNFAAGEESYQEAEDVVAAADTVAAGVQSVLVAGQAFTQKMLADVNRVPHSSAEAVTEAIQQLQKQIDEGTERLRQFNANALGLKRQQLLRAADKAVSDAETEVHKLADVTASLVSIGSSDNSAEALKEGMQLVVLAERSVQTSILTARKSLIDTSSELRKLPGVGGGPAPEVANLQARMNTVQKEAVRLRNTAKNSEERVKARGALKEVVDRVRVAEAEAGEAISAIADDDESLTPEAVERTEKLASAARGKLGVAKQLVSLKLKAARGAVKDELHVLEATLKDVEEKLAKALAVVDVQRDRVRAAELVAQATERVEHTELEVRKAIEAELPFLTGVEVLATDVADDAVATCEEAVLSAQKAIADGRAFVARTHVEAKRLSASAWDSCTADFSALLDRLNQGTSKVSELQRDMSERRRSMQQQLSEEKVSSAEAQVQRFASVLERFPEDKLSGISADEAHSICEELARVESEAHDAMSIARSFLADQAKQVKSIADARAMTTDLSKLQARLRQQQIEFGRISREWQAREQRFVAQQMLKEVPELILKIEAQVEAAHKAAAPILASDKTQLLRDVQVQSVMAAIQAHIKASAMSGETFFATVTSNEIATVEELSAFLDKMSYPGSVDGAGLTGIPGLSGEQAAKLLVLAAGSDTEGLSVDGLQGLLRDRWVCTKRAVATDSEGGTEVTTIQPGEVVEELARKQDADGSVHAQCILARDGVTAWVTLESPKGGAEFELSVLPAGRVESIAAFIDGVCTRCSEVAKDAEQKAEMCATQGPLQGLLADVRSKLLHLKMKANVHFMKMDQLRKRVASGKTSLLQKWEEAQQRALEAQCKLVVAKQVKEATDAVEAAEVKAAKVVDGVKAGKVFKLQKDEGAFSLDSIKDAADDAIRALGEAKGVTSKILQAHEADKSPHKNLFLDVRVQLMKLVSRVTSMERKCRMATDVVCAAQVQAEKKLGAQALAALRTAVQRSGQSSDELFDRYADAGEGLTEGQLGALVEGLPGHTVERDKAVAALRSCAADRCVSRSEFAEAVQDFRVCIKGIAITGAYEIEKAGLVRMLDPCEFFEVLEAPPEEIEVSSAVGGPPPIRLRGRAVRDGATGWATVTGNRGTVYLQPTRKPYVRCTREVTLRDGREDTSLEVAKVSHDQILELLEGPSENRVDPELVLHGRASRDGAEGWFTLRDLAGGMSATLSQNILVCRSAIAMTDVFDIHKCAIVRKIGTGELLEAAGDEEKTEAGQQDREDSSAGVARRQFRALCDGATGWVTVRGSQGTVYLEASKSHYVLAERVPLHHGSDAGSAGVGVDSAVVVRWLEAGEAFEATGPPSEGKPQAPRLAMRVRIASSSKSGWVSWPKSSQAPLQLQTSQG